MIDTAVMKEKDEEDFYDKYHTNGYMMYVKEICRYPLLSFEEERELLKTINENRDSLLLLSQQKDGHIVTSLNLGLLFKSLCDILDYNTIIDSLIGYYSVGSDKSIYELIIKYDEIAKKLGRGLNKKELRDNFPFIKLSGESLERLSLLRETKKFIDYKLAFEKMYVSNLRLVISIAKAYRGFAPYSDIVAEGNLGLMKAIDRFDLTRSNKFSTYATWWIRKSIIQELPIHNSSLNMSADVVKKLLLFKRKVNKLVKTYGRELTNEEIAKELKISLKSVEACFKYSQGLLPLNKKLYDDSERTLFKVVGQNDFDIENIGQADIKEEVKVLLKKLTPNERKVIEMYYGLNEYSGSKLTLNQIADIMGVSHQRTHQLKDNALARMKEYIKSDENNKDRHAFREFIR